MRIKLTVLIVLATTCVGSLARAEDTQWQFNISPYIWVPSSDSELGVNGVPFEAESDTDLSNVLDVLDFAMLVNGEARYGKFALLYDVQYIKLSDHDGQTTGPAPRELDTDVTFAAGALALEYRIIEQPKFALDVFGGARVLYADVGLDVEAGVVLPALAGGQSKTWVDPIVGAKCDYQFAERWGLHGYADIGGFGVGSDLTYQLAATVSFSFNEHVALEGGYCVYDVEFEDGSFRFETLLHGPIVGLAFSF